jgi:hypothetical protein
MKPRLSPRASLVIIAALFLLPLLLAWFMYSGAIDYKPSSTRNFGQLVEPPLPMAWDDTVLIPPAVEPESGAAQAFSDHWVILYTVPDPCLEACFGEVTSLRQIHLASGRHQDRIRIALLMQEPISDELETSLRNTYSKFHFISAPTGLLSATLEQAAGGEGSTYLIDPLGNIMMFYAAGADPNHLKQDLKRLLTWSKLDK